MERDYRRRRALARRSRRCACGGGAGAGRRTCGTPAGVVCGRGSVTFHCCHSRRGGRKYVVVFKCEQCDSGVSILLGRERWRRQEEKRKYKISESTNFASLRVFIWSCLYLINSIFSENTAFENLCFVLLATSDFSIFPCLRQVAQPLDLFINARTCAALILLHNRCTTMTSNVIGGHWQVHWHIVFSKFASSGSKLD